MMTAYGIAHLKDLIDKHGGVRCPSRTRPEIVWPIGVDANGLVLHATTDLPTLTRWTDTDVRDFDSALTKLCTIPSRSGG